MTDNTVTHEVIGNRRSDLRRFLLLRRRDPTGISGVGVVAEGALLSDGQCVLHWLTDVGSINIYRSVEDLTRVHGHEGATALIFCMDDDAWDATLENGDG